MIAASYNTQDAIERERERILSNDECLEFGEALLRVHHDELLELVTGAYTPEGAHKKLDQILESCDADLTARAESNLHGEP